MEVTERVAISHNQDMDAWQLYRVTICPQDPD